jgi:hypothetical protein
LQVAFEQGAGVLEVRLKVGFGGGDAVKGFVEDGDDAVLFGSGGTTIGGSRTTEALHEGESFLLH